MFTKNIRILFSKVILICLVAVTITTNAKTVDLPSTKSLLKGGVRIVGGQPIKIDKAPYIVQLRNKHQLFFCAGTLVSELFVVTAAHCLNGRSPANIRVVAGASLIDGGEPGVERLLDDFWLPPEYERGNAHMDVAVLKLKSPIKRSRKIRAVKLCESPPPIGKTITVTGWGRTAWDAIDYSNTLQYIEIPIVSMEECIQRHENISTKITDTMICASQSGIKDACGGDSGGPGLFEDRLCAIVSWGMSCARADYPGVYTSIPTVRQFIDDCMKK